ncbi:Pyridine nucleotide-disulfide oxidoreductase domain-containing protein 2 [Trichoplax sp. H2]|nr:Pyridine nucleotide-disulfide oxidoreductase domain-containing protein 2 [Trichoplax sp. H2]|eukprot:RDD38840.1 Pyridine nucleotide-disulfide oxidoreductase domain-containing protein 2 [Trichoplax sp. H2]
MDRYKVEIILSLGLSELILILVINVPHFLGHNGLVAAAYLQKAGLNVGVFENREIIGGAAVTEEIFPGFKFSRCSYVLSLLRPQIIKDLELKKFGLKVYIRDPSSYTPVLKEYSNGVPKALMLGRDGDENRRQIAQFSRHDAEIFDKYEAFLAEIVSAIDPLYDHQALDIDAIMNGNIKAKWKNLPSLYALLQTGVLLIVFLGLLRYVLLHHVMGEVDGIKGAWGYAEGGMGAVSSAIARCAESHGASIFTNSSVKAITLDSKSKKAVGIVLKSGEEISARVVLSNATPYITYTQLLPNEALQEEHVRSIRNFDYSSPVAKINVAINQLPNFTATPNTTNKLPGPQHRGTIHLNCEHPKLIHDAYEDLMKGEISKRPVIEMCIPSAIDPTVAPSGSHVVSLFTQYVPYKMNNSPEWTTVARDNYANAVFENIDEYAPNFSKSILGYEVLAPPDLQKIFGLTSGNIFHGALSPDQLYFNRSPTCPNKSIKGVFICGSGSHPGGGVSGAPGRLAALNALSYLQ